MGHQQAGKAYPFPSVPIRSRNGSQPPESIRSGLGGFSPYGAKPPGTDARPGISLRNDRCCRPFRERIIVSSVLTFPERNDVFPERSEPSPQIAVTHINAEVCA